MDTTERPLALTVGQKLGPYEIVSPLGAGGMGELRFMSESSTAQAGTKP